MNEHLLAKYRKQKGLTQYDLAKLLGISVASVSRIEHGLQAVTTDIALKAEIATHGAIKRMQLLYPKQSGASAP